MTKRAEQKEVIDLVDEVLEEELKNRKDVIKPVTFGYDPIAPTDPKSDSDTEEVVRKLPEIFKHIKFTEFSKLTPHAEISSEARGVKRKRSKKHKVKSRKRQRNERVEFLERNVRPIKLHEEDNRMIEPKIERLKKDELNIIAIDVEKMTVKGRFLKNVDIAC